MVALAEGLAAALPGKPEVDAQEVGDGSVRVNVRWPEGGWAKLDVHPGERVYWYSLNGPKSARRLNGVHRKGSEFFAARGIHRFECAARDDESLKRLLKCGDWRPFTGADGFDYLGWDF